MARHINTHDPYDLQLLRYERTERGGLSIEQRDLPIREAQLPDGRILRAWTTRPLLGEDLYDHIESVVEVSRHHESFPQPGELTMPSFHADLALPNLTPRETWDYIGDPEQLAQHLRLGEGAIMPASMRDDLHADSTLAWYGDLHVDHIGAVFQMEALKRDQSALRRAETPDSTMAARSHLAVLEHHGGVLLAELHERRMDTRNRQCSPDELIGAQSADWTRDARVRELRTWPGDEHTARTIAEYDSAVATWRGGPDSESLNNFRKINSLEENFSTTMSKARIQEWSDQSRPSTAPGALPSAMTLTEEVDQGVRAHTNTNDGGRGIRHEPKRREYPPTPHEIPPPEPISSNWRPPPHKMRRPSM